ncbi:hypothetical protein [Candidatus Poriferisodalis sp.]|uniref:hypothetical protein n=1 Tax=Candidatus Poriferisodalis sp. TaxID=3101277 RepID=UPI003B0257E6
MLNTYEFCLIAEGADLASGPALAGLERAGYVRPGPGSRGLIQTLAFIRDAESLTEAAEAAVSAAERIEGVCFARHARSGEVTIIDATVIGPVSAPPARAPACEYDLPIDPPITHANPAFGSAGSLRHPCTHFRTP